MRRLTHLALLICALFLAASPIAPESEAARSKEYEKLIVNVSKPGAKNLPLALPKPTGGRPEADAFWRAVWRDLEISGYFHLVDADAYIEPATAGVRPGTFSFDDWSISDTVVLAKTVLSTDEGKIRSEVWIYDVPGGAKIGAKAFTGNDDQVRRLAHRVADEIIFRVTGTRSIFNTRFAAINKGTGNKEVYVLDVDGEGIEQITRNQSINIQPGWSPGGDKLLYTSYRNDNPDLYVADLSTGRTQRLSNRQGINTGGAWSPGGDQIALTLSPNGDSDIYLIEPYSGQETAQLTRSQGIDVSPSWSPDGSMIAFVSQRSGGPQIYIMPAGGGGAERVTFEGSFNTDPSWSPTGDRIAYVTRGEDHNFDVMTVRTDGTGTIRITQRQGDNEDPSWSPDGRYLAFASSRSGDNEIWISTADGRHQSQITRGNGSWSNPAWSPVVAW